ncbi:hypothetical protein HY251_16450, partial [bacterium]|nr:hypothetical protein [bacterium]
MAQSYDVYFARMLLTRELVDREKLQKALATYQKTGLATGFPQFLVEKGVLTQEASRKAASDLEKWFEKRARKAAERGEEADVPEGWTGPAPEAVE